MWDAAFEAEGAALGAPAGAAAGAPAPEMPAERHNVDEHGDATRLEKPDPQETKLSPEQLLTMREVVVYWSTNRGSMNGRSWKEQLQDKIKELDASVAVHANTATLTDRLLVTCLRKLLKDWENPHEQENMIEQGQEIMFTPGSPPPSRRPQPPPSRRRATCRVLCAGSPNRTPPAPACPPGRYRALGRPNTVCQGVCHVTSNVSLFSLVLSVLWARG